MNTTDISLSKETIADYFQDLQDRICKSLETADAGAKFTEDNWERPGGGGGKSRIIQNGNVIEKGGVGFSAVFGEGSESLLKQLNLKEKADFFATGVSIVIHPKNPWVPIIHMNVRYFEMSNGTYWFGGGIDLTPHYVIPEDARYFHTQLKTVCDKFNAAYYPKFKDWADDYFYIKHRQETRGIGGIFYDYLAPKPPTEESEKSNSEAFILEPTLSSLGVKGLPPFDSRGAIWEFEKALAESFVSIYTHFMHKNKDLPFTEKEKQWQLIRRGRYAEFNLVWDRGTKFGLETNGRTESILMSLPPQAEWHYNFQPEPESKEAETLNWLRKGVNWIDL